MINLSLKLETSIEINATLAEVWDALVNPETIKKYFFGTETKSDWQKGSNLTFEGTWEGTPYVDKGTILEIRPLEVLKYNYISSFSSMEDLPENRSILSFYLHERDQKVTLSMSQEGFENKESYEHSSNNWSQVLSHLKTGIETGNW